MTADVARHRGLLIAALAALRVRQSEPELAVVHRWLDNWTGIGHIVVGMERQGYALSLTKVTDDGWQAPFHAHPQLGADGFATDERPSRAVQLAAWNTLGSMPHAEAASSRAEDVILP